MQLDHSPIACRVRIVYVLATDPEFAANLLLEVFGARPCEYDLALEAIEACAESFDKLLVLSGLRVGAQYTPPPIVDWTLLLITPL